MLLFNLTQIKKSKFLYKNRVENVYKPYYNIFIKKKRRTFMKKIKRLVLFLLCAVLTLSSVACVNDSSEHVHKTVHRTGIVPTCEKTGKLEH